MSKPKNFSELMEDFERRFTSTESELEDDEDKMENNEDEIYKPKNFLELAKDFERRFAPTEPELEDDEDEIENDEDEMEDEYDSPPLDVQLGDDLQDAIDAGKAIAEFACMAFRFFER